MAVDDLSKPLGAHKKRRMQGKKISLLSIGAGLVVSAIAAIVIWVSVVDNPLGGEPVALVDLNKGPGNAKPITPDLTPILRPTVNNKDVTPASPNIVRNNNIIKITPPEEPEGKIRIRNAEELNDKKKGLSTRPDKRVTGKGAYGFIPKVSQSGLRPLDVYADYNNKAGTKGPRIAIIMGGMGISQTYTQSAISELPASVTFAFAPYGNSLARWVTRARQEGHEILLQIPLEPFDYPDNDPGPHTLLSTLPNKANIDRLHWLMSRITNYVGVINYMGAKFTTLAPKLGKTLTEIKERGLLFIDDGSSQRSLSGDVAAGINLPYGKADITLDLVPSENEIDSRLLRLEQIARTRGVAIAITSGLPITIRKLKAWIKDVNQRGFTVVPITKVVDH